MNLSFNKFISEKDLCVQTDGLKYHFFPEEHSLDSQAYEDHSRIQATKPKQNLALLIEWPVSKSVHNDDHMLKVVLLHITGIQLPP